MDAYPHRCPRCGAIFNSQSHADNHVCPRLPAPGGAHMTDECGPYHTERILSAINKSSPRDFDPDELPLFPRFASYEERLRSYENWPVGIPVTPEALSNAGFFSASQGDKTFCFQCGGMFEGWSANDDPMANHAKYYSSCNYLSSLRGSNMVVEDPSVPEFCELARAQENIKDALNTVQELVSSIDINKIASNNQPDGINLYVESERLRTFKNWSVPFINARDLAAAGFHSTGISDTVKCTYCEIEVGRWVLGDDPFHEHMKHSPRCPFMLQKSIDVNNLRVHEHQHAALLEESESYLTSNTKSLSCVI